MVEKIVAIYILCRVSGLWDEALWPTEELVCWKEAVFTNNFCGL